MKPSGLSRRQEWLALGAALVSVVLWGSGFVGIRAAGIALSPGPLSLLRLLVASLTLVVLIGVRRQRLPPRRDYLRLAVCGVLWFGIYNVALNAGERTIDAGTAAMLVNTGPILIAVLGGLLLHEGFPRRLLIGCAVAFIGTCVIGFATSVHGLTFGVGALLCLVAAAAYAAGVVIEKPLLARSSALTVTCFACIVGAICCLPFARQLIIEAAGAEPGRIAWAVYLGVAPTAIGFSTWAYALARSPAGRLGATTYLVPPLAVAMSWLLLSEVPSWLALGGGALCFAGVALASGFGVRRRRLPHETMIAAHS